MADKKLKPGDVGWTHPDVRGDTNPVSIKALSDAFDAYNRQERKRIMAERANRKQ